MEDLHLKIGEMAASQAISAEGKNIAFDIDLLNEEKARVKKLKDSQKKLSQRLEEAEKELRELKEQQKLEDFGKETFASIEATEKAENLEGKVATYKNKISFMKKSLDETTAKLR